MTYNIHHTRTYSDATASRHYQPVYQLVSLFMSSEQPYAKYGMEVSFVIRDYFMFHKGEI